MGTVVDMNRNLQNSRDALSGISRFTHDFGHGVSYLLCVLCVIGCAPHHSLAPIRERPPPSVSTASTHHELLLTAAS
jgi:hypothetical protein